VRTRAYMRAFVHILPHSFNTVLVV